MLFIESHAASVFQIMHVNMYKKLLLVLQHKLATKGYLFTKEACVAATIPDEMIGDIGEEIVKAKLLYIAPDMSESQLANYLSCAALDNETRTWVAHMIAALAEQGIFLTWNPEFSIEIAGGHQDNIIDFGEEMR